MKCRNSLIGVQGTLRSHAELAMESLQGLRLATEYLDRKQRGCVSALSC